MEFKEVACEGQFCESSTCIRPSPLASSIKQVIRLCCTDVPVVVPTVLDGETLGPLVGNCVGRNEGKRLGDILGLVEGNVDGLSDGDVLGDTDGNLEGPAL